MSDVYNRIELENGRVLIDITDATATANDVISGSKFHDATGNLVDGTAALKDDADEIFVTGIAYDGTTEKKFVGSVDSTKTDVGDIVRSTTKIATPENIVCGSDSNIYASNIITGRTCYTSSNGSPLVGTCKPKVDYSRQVGYVSLNKSTSTYTYTFTESDIKIINACKYCTLMASPYSLSTGIWGMQSQGSPGGINRIFIKNNGEIPVGTYNMDFYSFVESGVARETNKITLSVQITSTQMIVNKTGTFLSSNDSRVYLFGHILNAKY